MKSLGGLIGGAIGGAVGAAIWAGISYGTGYEIGWIAWGVGVLVGIGFAVGARGAGGVHAGIGAVIITLLSIAGGKYAAIQLALRAEVGSRSEFLESTLADLGGDEQMISYTADRIIERRTDRGETVQWPPGVDPDEAVAEEQYPAEIWAEARAQWDGMSEQEQQASRDEMSGLVRLSMGMFYDEAAQQAFTGSFGVMDLLFFGLAVATAYRIAAREGPPKPQPPQGSPQA